MKKTWRQLVLVTGILVGAAGAASAAPVAPGQGNMAAAAESGIEICVEAKGIKVCVKL